MSLLLLLPAAPSMGGGMGLPIFFYSGAAAGDTVDLDGTISITITTTANLHNLQDLEGTIAIVLSTTALLEGRTYDLDGAVTIAFGVGGDLEPPPSGDVDLDSTIDIAFGADAALSFLSDEDIGGTASFAFDFTGMLAVYVPPIPPPSGMAMSTIRRVSIIMPAPTLNSEGVPV